MFYAFHYSRKRWLKLSFWRHKTALAFSFSLGCQQILIHYENSWLISSLQVWSTFKLTAKVREVIWNAPKSMWKMIFSCDSICIIIWNAPKSKNLIFGSFSVLKLITCQLFEMPHFSFLILKIIQIRRKWNSSILGHSNKWANVITWQNHLSHAFWGISYYSP